MMWNGICPIWNGGAFGAWGWAGMIISVVLWVALIAGSIYLVVWLARRIGGSVTQTAAGPAHLSAVEIARLRYARGEIDRESYLKLVEDLKEGV
jgi:putative membrane protein